MTHVCSSADRSIYNAFGCAFMSFMNALMTYEPQHIAEASAVLGRACDTLDKFRHKVRWGSRSTFMLRDTFVQSILQCSSVIVTNLTYNYRFRNWIYF